MRIPLIKSTSGKKASFGCFWSKDLVFMNHEYGLEISVKVNNSNNIGALKKWGEHT